jgi:GT2 family glycosyltransferase
MTLPFIASPTAPTLLVAGGPARPETMRTIIGIASARRAAVLADTVEYLRSMKLKDVKVVICVPNAEDAAGLADQQDVEILIGPQGLTKQRNKIIRSAMGRADLLIFFDDDFIPRQDYVAHMQAAFVADDAISIATGGVIADGILGAGYTVDEAIAMLPTATGESAPIANVYNAYGCNMAVRLSVCQANNVLFDEDLPLYGWLEDVDFSRAIARHGRSVRVDAARGVHMGVRSGRQPGLKLGYSQMANPAYLAAKGTLARWRAMHQMARNLCANLAGSFRINSPVDRRGRLKGNLLALADLVRGRASPSRILNLETKPAAVSIGSMKVARKGKA